MTHYPAYPLLVGATWRATCKCHYWAPLTLDVTMAGFNRVTTGGAK